VSGVEVVGTAQQRAWIERVMPPVERLEAGLWSVPVPIPANPLRYTLCYLIPGDDGLVVVDPGWDTDAGWAALEAGLAAAGATTADVVGIVATHVHPDHHGLSQRLADRSGAWVGMHPLEAKTLPARSEEFVPQSRMAGWLCGCGASTEDVGELVGGHHRVDMAAMARPDVLLEDDAVLPLKGRTVRAVWTPGHTPGHLCLLEADAGVMLTGDHVLPRITPNISVQRGAPPDPLGDYLDSLARTRDLDEDEEQPAHEWRFRGLPGRVDAITAHHERRLAELLAAAHRHPGSTPWELAGQLTWSRPWAEYGGQMRIFAVTETAAHLDLLEHRGLVTASGTRPPGYRATA
jgi:glyoxylase-like metal-dependent hydrolase (beta-lactamase superfamily II)